MNISRLQNLLSKSKGQCFLINNSADIFYLTGVNLDGFWLLVTKKDAWVFSSPLVAQQIRSLLPEITVFEADKILGLLFDFCKKNKIKKISLNPQKISYSLGEKISSRLKIEKTDDFLSKLRIIKNECEIDNIKKSCNIAVSAMKYAQSLIFHGNTEENICFKIEEFFAKQNVRPSFTPIVASGPNSSNPHHISSKRKIEKNDTVLIDLGCVYNGYCSDLTRTFFLGKIDSLRRRIFNIVTQAQINGINSVIQGVKACNIDRKVREFISSKGFNKNFIHSTGHGIGVEIHEPPRLSKTDKTVIKSGMTITIEPGIYLPGEFGVRIEDTILVKEKGSEVLTK